MRLSGEGGIDCWELLTTSKRERLADLSCPIICNIYNASLGQKPWHVERSSIFHSRFDMSCHAIASQVNRHET